MVMDYIDICFLGFNEFSTNSAMVSIIVIAPGDMIQSVFGHRGIVTCVGFSPKDGLHGNKGDGLIGSGSQDTTVLLWKWSGRLNRVTGPLSKIEGK